MVKLRPLIIGCLLGFSTAFHHAISAHQQSQKLIKAARVGPIQADAKADGGRLEGLGAQLAVRTQRLVSVMTAIPFQTGAAILYVYGCGLTYAYTLRSFLPLVAAAISRVISLAVIVLYSPIWLLLTALGAVGRGLCAVSSAIEAYAPAFPAATTKAPLYRGWAAGAAADEDPEDPKVKGRALARRQMLDRAAVSTGAPTTVRLTPRPSVQAQPLDEVTARVKAKQAPIIYSVGGAAGAGSRRGGTKTATTTGNVGSAMPARKAPIRKQAAPVEITADDAAPSPELPKTVGNVPSASALPKTVGKAKSTGGAVDRSKWLWKGATQKMPE